MVRQRSRKTVEELYNPAPPTAPLATSRFDDNFFQNSKNNKSNKVNDKADQCTNKSYKKTKGPFTIGGAEKKDEKTFINEERLHGKTNKCRKPDPFQSSNLDNKNLLNFTDETEKDEDTEEFFELIRQTVENAVGKTLSDILNRNFREVSAKIDVLREQLNSNEDKLVKLKADVSNKIVHYGEENSRHFRYLCMKSEYDKMFYQHQNIMTAMPVDGRPNVINPYPQQFAAPGQPTAMPSQATHLGQQSGQQHAPQQHQQSTQQMPQASCSSKLGNRNAVPACSQCNCHNPNCGDYGSVEPSKSSSMSTKSSEMGIKEVKELLEQLQKFYEHQQCQDKDERKDTRGDIALHIEDDSADGDEDDDSSDELSSASIEEKLGAGGDS